MENYRIELLEEKVNKLEKIIQGNGSDGLQTKVSLLEKSLNEIEKGVISIKTLLWGEEGNQENSLIVIISKLNTKIDIYSILVAGVGSIITGLIVYFLEK